MSARLFRILTALTGIFSVPLLYVSFNIVPSPPSDLSKVFAYARQYHNGLIYGGWLQVVSALIIVLFALAIVHLAGATTHFAGWATMVGGIFLVMMNLLEAIFYLFGAFLTTKEMAMIDLDLIHALQHFYMLASATLIVPLGMVIVQSRVLPRLLGYVAIVAGVASIMVGFVYFSLPIVDGVPALSIMQDISSTWYPVTAIVLLICTMAASHTPKIQEREEMTV